MRRNPDAVGYLNNCERCMSDYDAPTRQSMCCGYEPPLTGTQPWRHAGYTGPGCTTCPGYTCKLPEVVEASWARFYLNKSSLAAWSDDPPTENLREAIQTLEIAQGEVDSWEAEQRRKANPS